MWQQLWLSVSLSWSSCCWFKNQLVERKVYFELFSYAVMPILTYFVAMLQIGILSPQTEIQRNSAKPIAPPIASQHYP
jgi:hypothetical protein